MLENILSITGAILQPADQGNQVHVHTVGANIKGCLFTGLTNLHLKLFRYLGHHLFHPRRMDAAVGNKLGKCQAGHLSTDRIEPGQNNSLRGVINDDINAGCRFNGTNIAALPSNNTPLHLIIGQGYHGNRFIGDIVSGIAGYGQGKDVLPLSVGGYFHLIFDAAQLFSRIHASLAFNGGHQLFLCLFPSYTCNFLKFIPLLINQFIKVP